MEWYLKVIRNYAGFSGRARRKEYWMFVLFNILFSVAASVLDASVGFWDPDTGIGPVSGLYSLFVLIPSIAVAVRRLHDTGRSGWWLLLVLIPLIGAIVLLVFMVQDGSPGPNDHGPDPKQEPIVA